jgi:protein arginine N-methyltransferase 1
MYSLAGYGDMIADSVRTAAYAEAIRRAVQPGCVVLDVGAGTGILSLIACQCGAGKVVAVEPSEAVELAREAARVNGFSDRLIVLRELSTRVSLPEQADVIVSDLRGVLPLFSTHIPDVQDARTRLLAPGGRLIPQGDRLWAALVEAPDLHRRFVGPWRSAPWGLDLSPALRYLTNTWCKANATAEQLLTEPQAWAELPYTTITSPHVQGAVACHASRDGTAHGVLLWFDSVLIDGVSFSNAPGAPKLIYGQAFFPWPEPVAVRAGDLVEVRLRAQLIGGDYVWCWDSTVRARDEPDRPRCQFRQSTFHGQPLASASLARLSAGFVPTLNEEAQLTLFALERMRAPTTLGELATELAARFPARLPTWKDALTYLGELATRYRL